MRQAALLFVISIALCCSKQKINTPEYPKSNKAEVEVKASPRLFLDIFNKTTVFVTITIKNPGEEYYCASHEIDWESMDEGNGSRDESDCPPYDPSMAKETITYYEHHEYSPGHHVMKVRLFKGNKVLHSENIALN